MGELSAIFKALSDPLRLRILRLLLGNGQEAYGAELAKSLDIPAYQLSRHLKVLKTTGLIRERREGRWVYYSLAQPDGELLEALRRLIANSARGGAGWDAKPASRKEVPRQRERRRPQVASELETFNWNQGPAIAGML